MQVKMSKIKVASIQEKNFLKHLQFLQVILQGNKCPPFNRLPCTSSAPTTPMFILL